MLRYSMRILARYCAPSSVVGVHYHLFLRLAHLPVDAVRTLGSMLAAREYPAHQRHMLPEHRRRHHRNTV